jgi:serine/threonine-protein kinase
MAVCAGCRSVLLNAARFCPQCGAPQPAQPVAAATGPGARLDMGWGQVVLGNLIGEGGMGSVYAGWLYYNPQGPRAGQPPHPVAVKVLHPLLTARAHVRQLFMGEATALRRLSHPNIVKFFELVEPPGQLAIVLEYIDGESLDNVIGRHAAKPRASGLPCIPFARAWHYFEQLLGALAATHEIGVVHRDVKPANLLVRRDGLCKLTDFGIARLPADVARRSGGMQPGTGAYMSPEQVLGRDLDGRSDLYSAAIMLWELITGRTPFDDEESSELMVRAAQVERPPPPVCALVPSAPPVVDALFGRALAKDPVARFQNAIELGNAFRTALGIQASPGWQAQQAFAKRATGIVVQVGERRSRGGTQPIPVADADAMRMAVAGAYRS